MLLAHCPLAPHMMLLLQMLENPEEFEAPHMIELPHRSDAPHMMEDPLFVPAPHMMEEPLLEVAPHIMELPPTNCELPHTAGPDHAWLVPQTADESPTR